MPFMKKENPQNGILELEQQNAHELQMMNNQSQPENDRLLLEQQEGTSSLTQWQQSLNVEIEEMIHHLRREYFNEASESWEVLKLFKGMNRQGKATYKEAKPLCSDECISQLVAMIKPLTSKNLINSNFSSVAINERMKRHARIVTILMVQNQRRYKIETADMDSIKSIFMSTCEPTFNRSLNAGERTANKSILKEFIMRKDQDAGKKEHKQFFGGWS